MEVRQKMVIFKGFSTFFFRTTGFQLQLLILIESSTYFIENQKKKPKRALSIVSFHILHGEYLLKQRKVVVQTPERKFKVNIARNATFEGH